MTSEKAERIVSTLNSGYPQCNLTVRTASNQSITEVKYTYKNVGILLLIGDSILLTVYDESCDMLYYSTVVEEDEIEGYFANIFKRDNPLYYVKSEYGGMY